MESFFCIHGYLWFSNWALLKFENRFYWGIIQQITPDSTSAYKTLSKPSILEPWNKPHSALNSSPVTYYILEQVTSLIWASLSSPLVNSSFIGLQWIEYKCLKQPGAAPSPIVVLGKHWWINEFMPWGAYLDVSWLSMCPACSVYSSWTEIILFVFTLTTYHLFSWAQNIPATVGGQCIQNIEHLWFWLACVFPMTWPCHCHLEAVWHRVSPLVIHWSVLGSSRPPLPEERREDSPGGFQQPAAGWRQEAQAAAETDQPPPGGWLRGAVPGLHPRGLHPQPPQSLFRPRPESRGCGTEDFPEEGTRKNPQTIFQSGKMVSENADEWAEVKNGSNSDCILESLTALKNQLLDGPHSRQISLWRWCLGISGFKNTDSNVKSKFRATPLDKWRLWAYNYKVEKE